MNKQLHPPFDVKVTCGDLGFIITRHEFEDGLWPDLFSRRMEALAEQLQRKMQRAAEQEAIGKGKKIP